MQQIFLTLTDALRRLTARESLIGGFVLALLVLNFERGYGLSEEMVGAIITAMLVGAGWRVASKS